MKLDALPFPLARLLLEMEEENDPGRKFRAAIRAFVGYLKGVSLLGVSEYLEAGVENEEIDEMIVGVQLRRPSLGHWNHFLRNILEHHRASGVPSRIAGLQELYFRPDTGKPKLARATELIDKLINIRNEYVHPDIEPPPEVAARLVREVIPLIEELIAASPFLERLPLLLAQEDAVLVCRGTNVDQFERLPADPRLRPGCFYLGTAREPLFLLAFLFFGPPENAAEDDKRDDILLYEGRTAKKVKFLRGNYLRYVENAGFRDVDKLLEEIKQRLGRDERTIHESFKKRNVAEPNWDTLYGFSKKSSDATILFHTTERKYHPALYQPRPALEAEYERLIDGAIGIAIFVGESGCGKTNLFCHLTETSLEAGNAALHFSGRNYMGGSFLSSVARELVVEEEDLFPYLRALASSQAVVAGRRLVIFVDAVNEYSDPASLLSALLDMDEGLRGNGITFTRLVISIRSECWRQIERQVDLSREIVLFTQDPDAKDDRPFVSIGRFTPEETEAAYGLYVQRSSAGAAKIVREHFSVRLTTPFSELPPPIRSLVANPIFMRVLAQSYDSLPEDLGPADILLAYYENEKNVPIRHRYCLDYFLRGMWMLRTDCLSEEQILALSQDPNVPEGDWRQRLAEYYTENPINATLDRFRCSNQECPEFGVDLRHEDLGAGTGCPLCGSKEGFPLRPVQVPVKSTFFFLVDEGILSVFESGDVENRQSLVRFTYDRLFEVMMARHLLALLGSAATPASMASTLNGWLGDTTSAPQFDDVFTNLLTLSFDRRSLLDPDDPRGVLRKIEPIRPNLDEFTDLLSRLLAIPDQRRVYLVSTALRAIGQTESRRGYVERILLQLAAKTTEKSDVHVRLGLARVVLTVARQLKFPEPLLRVGQHPDPTFRMQAAVQTYFLWREDEDAGLDVIARALDRMFWPGGIPKPAILEYSLGTALLILFGHPTATRSVDRILGMGRSMTLRMGWLLQIVAWVFPKLVERILDDVPPDCNWMNLSELRASKALYLKDSELRRTVVECAVVLRGDKVDRERVRALCSRTIQCWPGEVFSDAAHGLMLAAAAQDDLDSTAILEVDLAMEALLVPNEHAFGSSSYRLYWLNVGEQMVGDSAFEASLGIWKEHFEGKHFSFECLTGHTYLTAGVVYPGLLLAARTGSQRVPFIEEHIDRLLAEGSDTGLTAVLRGLEIAGVELGTGNPRAVWMTLGIYGHILSRQPQLQDRWMERIAEGLSRMEVIHPEDVRVFFEALEDGSHIRRLRALMKARTPKENIGIWLGARVEVFYLYAMGQPYWRAFFADLVESFATSPGLGATIRFVTRKILQDLRDHRTGT